MIVDGFLIGFSSAQRSSAVPKLWDGHVAGLCGCQRRRWTVRIVPEVCIPWLKKQLNHYLQNVIFYLIVVARQNLLSWRVIGIFLFMCPCEVEHLIAKISEAPYRRLWGPLTTSIIKLLLPSERVFNVVKTKWNLWNVNKLRGDIQVIRWAHYLMKR